MDIVHPLENGLWDLGIAGYVEAIPVGTGAQQFGIVLRIAS
jgi:hypothetical protein